MLSLSLDYFQHAVMKLKRTSSTSEPYYLIRQTPLLNVELNVTATLIVLGLVSMETTTTSVGSTSR